MDPGAPSPTPQRGERDQTPRWGMGDAVAGLLLALVLSSLVFSAWQAQSGRRTVTFGLQLAGWLATWVGLAGAPLLASRRKGSGRLGADFGLAARRVDGPVGLLTGIGCQLLVVPAVAWVLRPLLGRPKVGRNVEELARQAHGLRFVLLALVVAGIVPVVEELFFRGLVLRALQRRFGPARAVLGSAALFGLVHAGDEPARAVILTICTIFVLGLVLGTMAVRSGRLGPSIWAHVGFNAVTLVALLLWPPSPSSATLLWLPAMPR